MLRIIINNRAEAVGDGSYAEAKSRVILRFRRKQQDTKTLSGKVVLTREQRKRQWINRKEPYIVWNS